MAQIQVIGFLSASLLRESPVAECVWGFVARWTAPVALRKELMQTTNSNAASPIWRQCESMGSFQRIQLSLYHDVVEIVPSQMALRYHCSSD